MGETSPVKYPRVRLAHLVSERDPASGSVEPTYTLQVIEVPRPKYGHTTTSVRCGSCDEPVTCTVYSVFAMGAMWAASVCLSAVLLGSYLVAWALLLGLIGNRNIESPLREFGGLGIFVLICLAPIVSERIPILWNRFCPKGGVAINEHVSWHSLHTPEKQRS